MEDKTIMKDGKQPRKLHLTVSLHLFHIYWPFLDAQALVHPKTSSTWSNAEKCKNNINTPNALAEYIGQTKQCFDVSSNASTLF